MANKTTRPPFSTTVFAADMPPRPPPTTMAWFVGKDAAMAITKPRFQKAFQRLLAGCIHVTPCSPRSSESDWPHTSARVSRFGVGPRPTGVETGPFKKDCSVQGVGLQHPSQPQFSQPFAWPECESARQTANIKKGQCRRPPKLVDRDAAGTSLSCFRNFPHSLYQAHIPGDALIPNNRSRSHVNADPKTLSLARTRLEATCSQPEKA